jgi:hypothetical protein
MRYLLAGLFVAIVIALGVALEQGIPKPVGKCLTSLDGVCLKISFVK